MAGLLFNSGIYKIANTINGKIYIGSAVNLAKRWLKHKRYASDFIKGLTVGYGNPFYTGGYYGKCIENGKYCVINTEGK